MCVLEILVSNVKHKSIKNAFDRARREEKKPRKSKGYAAGQKPKKYSIEKVDTIGVGPKGKYIPFDQARIFCHETDLIKSKPEYKRWVKVKGYKFMPLTPEYVYREYWQGWSDYLGVEVPRTHKTRYSYQEAKQEAQRLALKYDLIQGSVRLNWLIFWDAQYLLPNSEKELSKKMPRNPDAFYEEWEGWPRFMGKKPEHRLDFLKQKEASAKDYNNNAISEYDNQPVYALSLIHI